MAEVIARQNAGLISLQAERDTAWSERDAAQAEIEKLRLLIRQLQRGRFGRRSEKLDPDQLQLGLEDLEQAVAAAEAAQEEVAARSSTPRPPRVRATQPGRPAGAPAAGRDPGRRRGQELPLLRRGHARHRRGPGGDARHHPGPAAGEGDPPPPLRLPGLRGGGGAGAGSRTADHGRDGDRGPARARAGGQVRRFPAPLPPGADLRPARDRARPLHPVRLGRPGLLVAGAAVAPLAPARDGLDPDLRRRHHAAGARPRPGPDQDRPAVGLRHRRPAVGRGTPPAVVFLYAEDRRGEHPATHLAGFRGVLQVDGYGGFKSLLESRPPGEIRLAFCWAHCRRRFYEIHQATGSPLAEEALRRIGELYAIEAEVRGRPAEQRLAVRQERSKPIVDALHAWLTAQLGRVSGKSGLAEAIRYALRHWTGLVLFLEDGRVELDTNSIERAIRPIALGRKNSLFAGSRWRGLPLGDRGQPGGDREAQRGRAPGVADRRARARGLGPDQGARARAAAALELEGRAARGCRRCLSTVTARRRLRCFRGIGTRKPLLYRSTRLPKSMAHSRNKYQYRENRTRV